MHAHTSNAAGSSLTGVTALCPWARHINLGLVLVQPRQTRPFITERLLMGRKESKQTKQNEHTHNHEKARVHPRIRHNNG